MEKTIQASPHQLFPQLSQSEITCGDSASAQKAANWLRQDFSASVANNPSIGTGAGAASMPFLWSQGAAAAAFIHNPQQASAPVSVSHPGIPAQYHPLYYLPVPSFAAAAASFQQQSQQPSYPHPVYYNHHQHQLHHHPSPAPAPVPGPHQNFSSEEAKVGVTGSGVGASVHSIVDRLYNQHHHHHTQLLRQSAEQEHHSLHPPQPSLNNNNPIKPDPDSRYPFKALHQLQGPDAGSGINQLAGFPPPPPTSQTTRHHQPNNPHPASAAACANLSSSLSENSNCDRSSSSTSSPCPTSGGVDNCNSSSCSVSVSVPVPVCASASSSSCSVTESVPVPVPPYLKPLQPLDMELVQANTPRVPVAMRVPVSVPTGYGKRNNGSALQPFPPSSVGTGAGSRAGPGPGPGYRPGAAGVTPGQPQTLPQTATTGTPPPAPPHSSSSSSGPATGLGSRSGSGSNEITDLQDEKDSKTYTELLTPPARPEVPGAFEDHPVALYPPNFAPSEYSYSNNNTIPYFLHPNDLNNLPSLQAIPYPQCTGSTAAANPSGPIPIHPNPVYSHTQTALYHPHNLPAGVTPLPLHSKQEPDPKHTDVVFLNDVTNQSRKRASDAAIDGPPAQATCWKTEFPDHISKPYPANNFVDVFNNNTDSMGFEPEKAFSDHCRPIPPVSLGSECNIHLWEFLLELLLEEKHDEMIGWTGNELEFILKNPDGVAQLWGERKAKPKMNYEKLARGLRYYYSKNILSKSSGRRYVYKFVCDISKSRVAKDKEEIVATLMRENFRTLVPPIASEVPCKPEPFEDELVYS